jgi:DNA polymerase III, beta subunit
MKINIAKQELNEAISHVSKAVSSRTSIPILSGIKLEANATGLTLTASDTEITIQNVIPAVKDDQTIIELERAGSVVLPAKFFVEIVKKLPSSMIEIEVQDNFITMIRAGSTEVQLVGLDPEEFPLLPRLSEEQMLHLGSDVLRNMIRQTTFAASTNETSAILTGILWSIQDDSLKFVATDRHRLASSQVMLNAGAGAYTKSIVVPAKTLNELSKILPDENAMIDIVIEDNQVLFRMENLLFYSRILDGMYPDTSRIIPTVFKTEFTIDTRQLTDALDRAYLLSREEKTNIVRLASIDDHRIEISSFSSELGKVTEQIEVENYVGEPLKIAFNSRYMLDVMKVMDDDRVHISFTGAMSPIIVTPENNKSVLHLILPYRTTN